MNRDGVELFGSTCLVDWAALPWRPHPGTRLAFGGKRPSVFVDQAQAPSVHAGLAIDMALEEANRWKLVGFFL
jgi:hypothetical protein